MDNLLTDMNHVSKGILMFRLNKSYEKYKAEWANASDDRSVDGFDKWFKVQLSKALENLEAH